jgi:hypothetical protein
MPRLGFPAAPAYKGRMTALSTIERAFALARSGTCANLHEIRLKLRAERYDQVDAHLAGSAISRQLRELCIEAREAGAA